MAFGPGPGGLLVGAFGWQSIFLVNLSFVAVSAACVLRFGPADHPRHRQPDGTGALRRLDPAGLLLFAGAMTSLMLWLLSLAVHPRWWLLAVLLPLVAVLLWCEHRAAEPFLDVRLLRRNRPLSTTYLRTALTYVAFYAIFYGVPSWLERGRGLSAAETGLVVLPIAGLGVFVAMLATRMVRTRGPRVPLLLGSFGLLVGGAGHRHALRHRRGGAAFGQRRAGCSQRFQQHGQPDRHVRRRATGTASGLYRTSQYVGANLAAALIEVLAAGAAPDVGLHRPGLAVAAIAVVLLAGAVAARRRDGSPPEAARRSAGSGCPNRPSRAGCSA